MSGAYLDFLRAKEPFVGDIGPITKKGWEYLWVQYEDAVDDDAKAPAVLAVDARTGKERWRWPVPAPPGGAPKECPPAPPCRPAPTTDAIKDAVEQYCEAFKNAEDMRAKEMAANYSTLEELEAETERLRAETAALEAKINEQAVKTEEEIKAAKAVVVARAAAEKARFEAEVAKLSAQGKEELKALEAQAEKEKNKAEEALKDLGVENKN